MGNSIYPLLLCFVLGLAPGIGISIYWRYESSAAIDDVRIQLDGAKGEVAVAKDEAIIAKADAAAAKAAAVNLEARIKTLRAELVDTRMQLRHATSGAYRYGPRIKILANNEPFVDLSFRDDLDVSVEHLGAYLSRLTFETNGKLTIKPDDSNARQAVVKANFTLSLIEQRSMKLLVTFGFDELRLHRAKLNEVEWLLTGEGINLIEKALPVTTGN